MKKKVLLVDDEETVRKVVRRALAKFECEILEVSDGDKAIAAAAKEKPSLVLLDIHMPRFDGIAALDEILKASPESTVIMLTGDSDVKRVKVALERGARDYLTKPVDVHALQTSVESVLLV